MSNFDNLINLWFFFCCPLWSPIFFCFRLF